MNIDNKLVGISRHEVDYLGNSHDFDCFGCLILDKKLNMPGGVIYEDDSFVLMGDALVPLKGFLTITSKRHIPSLIDLTSDEQHRLTDIISRAISTLKELGIVEKVSLIQEERSSHFHVWIFPNYEWAIKKFGDGVSHVRDICEYVINNATPGDIKEVLNTINRIREKY